MPAGNPKLCEDIDPLKPKLVTVVFNNSVRTSKRTTHFTITKINWLMLFKEMIAVYSEKHSNPFNTKIQRCRLLK
jgi:hypothetical protein